MVAMAVDAFANNDTVQSRLLLKMALFLKAFKKIACINFVNESVEDTHSASPLLSSQLEEIKSRSGLIMKLQKLTFNKCFCMFPKELLVRLYEENDRNEELAIIALAKLLDIQDGDEI